MHQLPKRHKIFVCVKTALNRGLGRRRGGVFVCNNGRGFNCLATHSQRTRKGKASSAEEEDPRRSNGGGTIPPPHRQCILKERLQFMEKMVAKRLMKVKVGWDTAKVVAAALEGGQKLSTRYEGAVEANTSNYTLIFRGGGLGG